jgi:uncharacterized membrane protein
MKEYLIILILDLVYLTYIGKPIFDKTIKDITNKMPVYNIYGIILSYVFILLAFKYFIINKKMSSKDAFILGLVIYGVFDMTNLALFDKYNINTAIIDTLWGATLFYLSKEIYDYLTV